MSTEFKVTKADLQRIMDTGMALVPAGLLFEEESWNSTNNKVLAAVKERTLLLGRVNDFLRAFPEPTRDADGILPRKGEYLTIPQHGGEWGANEGFQTPFVPQTVRAKERSHHKSSVSKSALRKVSVMLFTEPKPDTHTGRVLLAVRKSPDPVTCSVLSEVTKYPMKLTGIALAYLKNRNFVKSSRIRNPGLGPKLLWSPVQPSELLS